MTKTLFPSSEQAKTIILLIILWKNYNNNNGLIIINVTIKWIQHRRAGYTCQVFICFSACVPSEPKKLSETHNIPFRVHTLLETKPHRRTEHDYYMTVSSWCLPRHTTLRPALWRVCLRLSVVTYEGTPALPPWLGHQTLTRGLSMARVLPLPLSCQGHLTQTGRTIQTHS